MKGQRDWETRLQAKREKTSEEVRETGKEKETLTDTDTDVLRDQEQNLRKERDC